VLARTHGFADHSDVVIAAEVARRLGIEHDPVVSPAITAGGHGGELLRGGYAEAASGRRATAVRAAELLRRLTARHLSLLRRGAAAGYIASLAPWTTALARGPLSALDDFYLVNRAGRWSAAARQAYLIRESLVQPLFGDSVVAAARAVPLAARTSGELSRAVLPWPLPPRRPDEQVAFRGGLHCVHDVAGHFPQVRQCLLRDLFRLLAAGAHGWISNSLKGWAECGRVSLVGCLRR
jgi:hypothetical protein